MFWIIAIFAGVALIIGGFLTGHWLFGIINGIVVFFMLGEGLNNKKKSFIILSILGSAVMIGGSILGIKIEHPIIAGILGLVVNIVLLVYMAGKEAAEAAEKQKALETRAAAGDKAAQEELQKQLENLAAAGNKAAREELRKQLETRAAAGDETAKQELIEQGTDYEAHFGYGNFDFDKGALQRVYDLTEAAMSAKGLPWFDMEEMKDQSASVRNTPYYRYLWKGKTLRGDTISILYQLSNFHPGSIDYKLHLKALPEEVEAIGKMVHDEMKKFLSTVPKWTPQMDKGANSYQSDNNYSSGDNNYSSSDNNSNGNVSYVYKGSNSYGDVVYTIKGDTVYRGSNAYGDAVYTIKGDTVYRGSNAYGDVAYTIKENTVYRGSHPYGDVVCTIAKG
jgi:hypothetical protein